MRGYLSCSWFTHKHKKLTLILIAQWLTITFSLKYPYILQQTGNENTQTYQGVVVIFITCQILITNLKGNVLKVEGRINNQILEVKGLGIICSNNCATVQYPLEETKEKCGTVDPTKLFSHSPQAFSINLTWTPV